MVSEFTNFTSYEAKDRRRISDILEKADGAGHKALSLARQMANAITDAEKALRRANAARAQGASQLAAIFYIRYGQLTS